MSEAGGAPHEPAHDPRLDASHEDLPGVRPSAFDLVALEHTRSGMRLLGLALAAVPVALPLVADTARGLGAWVPTVGWVLTAAGFLCMALGVAIMASTPHGPLPRSSRWALVVLCVAASLAALAHALGVLQGITIPGAKTAILPWVDHAGRGALLLLPWILWRYCQHRGLTGRAIVWIWLAMASGALAIVVAITETRWFLWGFPALGVLAFFAAQQTARDLWLDAVYRHTKNFVRPPGVTVEGLRPAGDRQPSD